MAFQETEQLHLTHHLGSLWAAQQAAANAYMMNFTMCDTGRRLCKAIPAAASPVLLSTTTAKLIAWKVSHVLSVLHDQDQIGLVTGSNLQLQVAV